jgi:nicotinate-nucleotide adenylyltransferase
MPSRPQKKTVIFGGAFSPPHLGHAIAIEKVVRLFPCDEVWLMPSADRKDKVITGGAEDRIRMLERMVSDLFPASSVPISISRIEVDRPRLTTTYETKLELEANYPDHTFYFYMGIENLAGIESSWVNGPELLASAHILTISRPGREVGVPENFAVLELVHLPGEEGGMEVSSTFLRNLAKSGRSLLPYVSSSVDRYIRESGLYSG